ncbi:hypothetical protein AU468_08825 [Alkalispirochaeta sphaeroplastigenens]|uniref:Uncharacterized protein n=1 Tax=Alkalispirochaeta sphaeroplastigenens TaxID=1187066 RepID=A0A2S4JN70_9SPIO|nr:MULTISPECIES: hypothetical protein [Alkalispirochaeta]POR00965.1 hypothetical protein AU468_08825 [Alkalispirochaeta sphaeroplastigenens]
MLAGPGELSVLVTDLALTGVGAFLAIMLWSMTREPAWMLVIIGIILRWGDLVFQTLDRFGIIGVVDLRVLNLPLFWVVLRAVPLVFIIAGIVSMIKQLQE